MNISPLVLDFNKLIKESSVDFPAPDGPIIEVSLPL